MRSPEARLEMSEEKSEQSYDDPVAETVVDGTPFRKRRLAVGITSLGQRTKLAVFAGVAGALALLLPIALTLPAAVRETFLGGAPLAASPVVLVVAVFGLLNVFAAGVTVWVVSRRARTTDLTEREALNLVAIDNVATMAGLGVASFAVLAALAGFAIGYGGVEAVEAFSSPDNGVSGPYSPFPALPLPSVATVGAGALCVCGVLLLLSRSIDPEV